MVIRLILLGSCLGLLIFSVPGYGASFRVSGQRITKQVVSLQELRQQKVVRQQWDFTCGAAALATMLRYQHGMKVEERIIHSHSGVCINL